MREKRIALNNKNDCLII